MILIFTSKFDRFSNKVISFLQNKNEPYLRINFEDFWINNEFRIEPSKNCLSISGFGKINFSKVKSVWFRRDGNPVSFGKEQIKNDYLNNVNNLEDVYTFFKTELSTLKHYIQNILFESEIKTLGNPKLYRVNKLEVLTLAEKAGLKIPKTLITTKQRILSEFMMRNQTVIVKPITEMVRIFKEENQLYYPYTWELTEEYLEIIGDNTFPSLFQEKIEKEFEIRTFFIDNKYFSVAIFSQAQGQTLNDYRVYNHKRRNRIQKVKLPKELIIKCDKLFKQMKLNTGSIDFIVSTKGEIYFLEVNPVGQVGPVASTGVAFDQLVANYLMN